MSRVTPSLLFVLVLAIPVFGDNPDVPSCFPCLCSASDDGKTANCAGKQLKDLPSNLPDDIVELSFEDNSLSAFESGNQLCVKYPKLKTVNLARNSLRELKLIFKDCENTLENLDFTGNTLTLESLNVFQHLQNLKKVNGLFVSGPTALKKEFFAPLKRLEKLEFTTDLPDFPLNLFADYKNLCHLRLTLLNVLKFENGPFQLDILHDLHLKFSKVYLLPETFFDILGKSELVELELEFPSLSRWELNDQQLFGSLKHLVVSGVREMTSSSVRGMTGLQTLKLNEISILNDENLFHNLSNLEVLNITGCQLITLPENWFSKLNSLTELYLQNDMISTLHKTDLANLFKLKRLDLSGNKIEKIPETFLIPVAECLNRLILKRNLIVALKSNSIPEMLKLAIFDLSKNNLKEFDLDLTQNMPSLKQLHLSNNRIEKIEGSLSSKVTHLDLAQNNLKQLPDGVMVKTLIDLNLSENDLVLPTTKLMKLDNLKELNITGLSVKCDCTLKHLFENKGIRGGSCDVDDLGDKSFQDVLSNLLCDVITSTAAASTSSEESLIKSFTGNHSNNNVEKTHHDAKENKTKYESIENKMGNISNLNGTGYISNAPNMNKAGYISNVNKTGYESVENKTKFEANGNKTVNESNVNVSSVVPDKLLTTVTEVYEENETPSKFPENHLLGTTTNKLTSSDKTIQVNESKEEEMISYQNDTNNSNKVKLSLIKPNNTKHEIINNKTERNVANVTTLTKSRKIRDGDKKDENEVKPEVIVLPIIAFMIIVIIASFGMMYWCLRKTGQHNLEYSRRHSMQEKEFEQYKLVLTELGRSQPGEEVIIL